MLCRLELKCTGNVSLFSYNDLISTQAFVLLGQQKLNISKCRLHLLFPGIAGKLWGFVGHQDLGGGPILVLSGSPSQAHTGHLRESHYCVHDLLALVVLCPACEYTLGHHVASGPDPTGHCLWPFLSRPGALSQALGCTIPSLLSLHSPLLFI